MDKYAELVLGKFTVSRFIKEQGKKGSSTSPLKRLKINRQKHTASLVELVGGAEDNLFSVRTVSPFVLIADTLKIDRQKLTVVHNALLGASQTVSIRLKDLRNVEADIGPLFGSITLTSQHFLNNTQTIKFLKRKDIIKAQRLLQGFMIAHEAQIDTDNIEHDELKSLLDKLGQENINQRGLKSVWLAKINGYKRVYLDLLDYAGVTVDSNRYMLVRKNQQLYDQDSGSNFHHYGEPLRKWELFAPNFSIVLRLGLD